MNFLVLLKFIAFPERKDELLSRNDKTVDIKASGSIGLYYGGKCHQTHPNETIIIDEKLDWCSNIAKTKEDKPWISYSLKNKVMKVKGYSVRNGCCWNNCCCIDDNNIIDEMGCCCILYSFSLHGSNDEREWKLIHKAEKLQKFYACNTRTFDFPETEAYKHIRFVQDEEYPGCPFCMQVNQIELYGTTYNSLDFDANDMDGNDESISIIGKIIRNENE